MTFILHILPSVFFLRTFLIIITLSVYLQCRIPPSKPNDQRPSLSDRCPSYTIISVRGTSELQSNPSCCSGFIKGVISEVEGGRDYEVVYPANMDFIIGPIIASNDIIRYVESIEKICPNQPLILIGYSQGAMGVVRALMTDEMQNKNVVAVVMYGNPYRTSDAPENFGTATGGRGLAAISDIKLPERYQYRTLDICLSGDIVCTGRGSMKAHLRYFGSPEEKEAIKFAVRNLQGQGKLQQIRSD
ncbi:cutinase [Melampsora americana]|nr:cutinase [Melampsora americana]